MVTIFDSPYIVKPLGERNGEVILPYFPERTADGIAGYCSERTAWMFLHDMTSALTEIHAKGYLLGSMKLSDIFISSDRFILGGTDTCHNGKGSQEDDIWHLGASAFHLLMGAEIWGGRERKIQKKSTAIPTLRKDIYSPELSDMITRCLSYDISVRPTLSEIATEAETRMKQKKTAAKSVISENMTDFPYEGIWPEKMTP